MVRAAVYCIVIICVSVIHKSVKAGLALLTSSNQHFELQNLPQKVCL
ncbi:hypothetical protein AVDCRST_MAG92-5098 [uncultured Coleofasciculus sp.]|uniref:Uncharacterized protein n=1 Tax=uncultured Coleofasciculus sp. TaxID=1267456 RepID=A0A6J4KBV2_9CYAN|nr:hypothetical protein AVDCRST_MAG92-5098 [uncultured Coleofasciculus sp.]